MNLVWKQLPLGAVLATVLAVVLLFPTAAMAQALNGVYLNQSNGAQLTITNANDENGSFSGSLESTINGETLTESVNGHYHFLDSVEDKTSINFRAQVDNSETTPSVYEGWAGITNRGDDYATLNMVGARSVLNDGTELVCPLGGPFIRQ